MPAKRFAKLYGVHIQAVVVLTIMCSCHDSSLAADIHENVRAGNIQRVIEILEKYPGLVDERNYSGETPLHRAVLEKQTEIVMVLLKHGADTDLRVPEGETPLHVAVYDGEKNIVVMLLEHGADPNLQGVNDWTPLFYACALSTPGPWEEIAIKLLEHGADISIGDIFGRTVLHIISYAPPDSVQKARNIGKSLIEKGAEVNKQDIHGNTPLHNAAATGLIPVIELLLEEGADPSIWNRQGQTPLRYVCTSDMLEVPIGKVVDIFGEIMDTDKIFEAARHGETEKLRDLVSSDMELILRKDPAGWTPLHWAAWGGSPDAVRLLLENGADPNTLCEGFLRPIDLAACLGFTKVASILIEHGALYYAPFSDGWTPLHFAAHWGQEEIASFLIEHGGDVLARNNMCNTPLCQAARMQRVEVAKILIGAGANVDSEGMDYCRPLHWATHYNELELAKNLLEAGAEVNARCKRDGKSPLFVALRSIENVDIINLLLKHGANPNTVNKWGRRAFPMARSPEVIRLCIDAGADVNVGDKDGTTALHRAVQRENIESIKVLLDAGANARQERSDGKTPLDLALEAGNEEIIEILQKE